MENTHHNFHSFENRCNFFSRWKLLLVSASKFRQHFFCGKQVNVTEQITMLIKACSWRQVRRLDFTGVPIVFYQALKPTSLDSAVSCLLMSTISLSLSPAEGHFVVETRLAMIHVCTSNENAYQERRVSYLRGIFDGLK